MGDGGRTRWKSKVAECVGIGRSSAGVCALRLGRLDVYECRPIMCHDSKIQAFLMCFCDLSMHNIFKKIKIWNTNYFFCGMFMMGIIVRINLWLRLIKEKKNKKIFIVIINNLESNNWGINELRKKYKEIKDIFFFFSTFHSSDVLCCIC